MSAGAVGLVVVSAFLHAWWNARAHGGDDRVAELTVAYGVGAVVLAPWLVVDPPTTAVPLVIVSGFAHALYLSLLAAAYRRGSLAVTYPVARGSAPLLVAVGAAVWLDQPATMAVLIGALLLGAGLMTIGGVAWARDEAAAFGFAGATGAAIAAYSVVDAHGVDGNGALGWLAAVSLVAVTAMMVGDRVSPARLRRSARAGAAVGLAQTAAYVLVLFAFASADAGRVATLRGASILFGLGLARRAVDGRIVAGAALVVAGAALVVL